MSEPFGQQLFHRHLVPSIRALGCYHSRDVLNGFLCHQSLTCSRIIGAVHRRAEQGQGRARAGQSSKGCMVSTVITMLPAGQYKGFSQESRAMAGQGKAARAGWSPLSSQCCQRDNTRAFHRRAGQGQGWMVSTVVTMLPAGQHKGCSQERQGKGRAGWSPLSSQCCQRDNRRAVHRRAGQGQGRAGKGRAKQQGLHGLHCHHNVASGATQGLFTGGQGKARAG